MRQRNCLGQTIIREGIEAVPAGNRKTVRMLEQKNGGTGSAAEKKEVHTDTAVHSTTTAPRNNHPLARLFAEVIAASPGKTQAELCHTLEIKHHVSMASPERRDLLARAIRQTTQVGADPSLAFVSGADGTAHTNGDARLLDAEAGAGDTAIDDAVAADAARDNLPDEEPAPDTGDAGDHEFAPSSGQHASSDAPGTLIGFATRTVYSEAPSMADTARLEAPTTMASGLPDALAPLVNQFRWVLWKWETRDGKPTKVPYQPSGKKAASDDPHTWSSYAHVRGVRDRFDGIGYCLQDSEYGAFDLDDCRDLKTGAIAPWAQELVAKASSYTEVTVSGTGLRIIGRAVGPEIHRKQPVVNGSTLETHRKAKRYIVMTGSVLPGSAQELADLDAMMDAVVVELDAAKQNNKRRHQAEGRAELPPHLANMLHVNGSGAYPTAANCCSRLLVAHFAKELPPRRLRPLASTTPTRGRGIYQHCHENAGFKYVDRQIAKARSEASKRTIPPWSR